MDRLYPVSDMTKIGVAFSVCGVAFTCLGMMMFFDAALITLGNMLFLVGLVVVMGPKRTAGFFFDRAKWRGTLCYFLGIVMVLHGYSFFGMAVLFFGALNLFGNFFPMLYAGLQGVPFVGPILRHPIVEKLLGSWLCGARRNV